jgi:hypothetical protein
MALKHYAISILQNHHLFTKISSHVYKSVDVFLISNNNMVGFHFKTRVLLPFTEIIEVIFNLQKKERSSSILCLPTVVFIEYSYFDTPTARWPTHYNKANPA